MIQTLKSVANGKVNAGTFLPVTCYARSSEDADTTTMSVAGLDQTSSSASEIFTLNGKREVPGVIQFSKTYGASLAAPQAGVVTLYSAGTPGSGIVYLTSQPVEGNTVTLGLTGNTQTYTYRSKAKTTAVCRAASSLTQGGYFDINLSGTVHRFWYDIDAAGTSIPADPGGGLHMVSVVGADTNAQVATATKTAADSVTGIAVASSDEVLTVSSDILGTMSVTDGPSDVLDTVTVAAGGTAQAARQVAIGADLSESASNLHHAINADGVAGDQYGTGTTAHPDLSATSSSGVVTITDRVACSRKLPWSFSRVGGALNVGTILGAKDGVELVTIDAGETASYTDISLDDEALIEDRLPGLINWASTSILLAGRPFSIYLSAAPVGTPMTASYEYSTTNPPTTWRTGVTPLAALDDNHQVITPNEVIENIRVKINNTNTSPASVNVKICSF